LESLFSEVYVLEILKRAKGDTGEIVPFNINEKDLQEEINRRTAKAGYTTKYGEPTSSGKIRSMPTDDRYRKNYGKIFGHD